MKKIISFIIVLFLIIVGGYIYINSKDNYDKKQFYLTKSGKKMDFKLPDQFNNPHILSNETKILIIAFEKEDGHKVREFLKNNKPTLLNDNKAFFIADISKVPVIIRNMFILKDLKKSKFPVLLIYDKKISTLLKEDKKGILILHLQNKKIIKSEYIHSSKELRAHLKTIHSS